MRVHALIDSLTWGGAEMLLGEFALVAPSAGIDLSVAFLQDRDGSPAARRLLRAGVQPTHLGISTLRDPRSLRTVRRHFAGVRPDILHSHLGYSDFLGGLAARSLGVPCVSTVHVSQWPRFGWRNAKEVLMLRLFARVRRSCMARVLTVSDDARRAYLGNRWDRAAHVVVVRNGVASRPQPGDGGAVRAQLGLRPEHLVISMVGVLRDGKGHAVAVEAVRLLRDAFPQARLLVVGDGPARTGVEALVASLGEAGIMTGHRDDVMAVLDGTDVLLHPTSHDALPTSLLEAMAAGVPVVATSVGGVPEIVIPGSTGVLVPPSPEPRLLADAVAGLLRDTDERRRVGRDAAARFQEHFSGERWAARLAEVYRAVLFERTPADG